MPRQRQRELEHASWRGRHRWTFVWEVEGNCCSSMLGVQAAARWYRSKPAEGRRLEELQQGGDIQVGQGFDQKARAMGRQGG